MGFKWEKSLYKQFLKMTNCSIFGEKPKQRPTNSNRRVIEGIPCMDTLPLIADHKIEQWIEWDSLPPN